MDDVTISGKTITPDQAQRMPWDLYRVHLQRNGYTHLHEELLAREMTPEDVLERYDATTDEDKHLREGDDYILQIRNRCSGASSEYRIAVEEDDSRITRWRNPLSEETTIQTTVDPDATDLHVTADGDMLYEVETDIYSELLDEDIAVDQDTVLVDRRGYAEDIADNIGEDYLQDRMLFFDTEQRHATLQYDEYTVNRYLINYAYRDQKWLDAFTDQQPLAAAIQIEVIDQEATEYSPEEQLFRFRLRPDFAHDPASRDRMERILDVNDLDHRNLAHQNDLEDILDAAPELQTLSYPEDEIDPDLGVAHSSNFGFEYSDAEGVAFSTEPLHVFTTGSPVDIPGIDDKNVDIAVHTLDSELLDWLDHEPQLRTHAQPHDIETWIQAAEEGWEPAGGFVLPE